MSTTRIIPARAGFTYVGDRPGVRTYGSSPLARGLQPGGERRGQHEGIIPARAGFTKCGAPPSQPSSDHPRSRGVYVPPAASRR